MGSPRASRVSTSGRCIRRRLSGLQILDGEGRIHQPDHHQGDRLEDREIQRPGREDVQQAGSCGFAGDEEAVAAQERVDDPHEDGVDVAPDEDALDRLEGRALALHRRHIDRGGDDRAVRDEDLEEADMRKAIETRIGREHGL